MRRDVWKSSILGRAQLIGAALICAGGQSWADESRSGRPVTQSVDWAGVYGGLVGGYSLGISDQVDIVSATGSRTYSIKGGLAGAGLGFNYQFGRWVIGLDGDFSKSSITGSNGAGFSSKENSVFLVRARIGYSIGDFLPFIGLGPSYAGFSSTGVLQSAGLVSGAAVRSGWSFSLGADYMITPSLFARAELTYICFGSEFLRNVDSIELMGESARVGLYYKFNLPSLRKEEESRDYDATSTAYDWSGVYFGPSVGGSAAWQHAGFTVDDVSIPTIQSHSAGGVRGFGLQGTVGFQAGANWRVGGLIAGVETDFHFSQLTRSGTAPFFNTVVGGAPTLVMQQDHIDELGTVRARIGVPLNRWLIYATAGMSYSGFSSDARVTIPGSTVSAGYDSTRIGAVAGIGVERAIWGQWTTRLEYMYTNFGNVGYRFTGPAPVGAVGTKIDVSQHILRVGFNMMLHCFRG